MKSVLKLIIILLLPCLAQAGVVKTIYFYPSDRTPQADIATILDTKMKEAQDSFAAILDVHGYSKKTFPLDTKADGNVSVSHVRGNFPDAYYLNDPFGKVVDELDDNFTSSDDIYFIAIDISNEVLDVNLRGTDVEACGVASGNWSATPAHGGCFTTEVIVHELAHNFGLDHNSNGNIVYDNCSAAWLDRHPFFNGGNTDSGQMQIEILPAQLSPNPAKSDLVSDSVTPMNFSSYASLSTKLILSLIVHCCLRLSPAVRCTLTPAISRKTTSQQALH